MGGKADGGASGITLISPEEPTHRTAARQAFGRERGSRSLPGKGTGTETGP